MNNDRNKNNNNNDDFVFKNIYRTNVVNDQPFGDDLLGYDKYARTLSYILLNEEIELPISVGIFSSWGTGKTFLLKKIEHQINELTKQSFKKFCISQF